MTLSKLFFIFCEDIIEIRNQSGCAAPRNELDTNMFETDSLFGIMCQPFSTLLNVVIHLLMEQWRWFRRKWW